MKLQNKRKINMPSRFNLQWHITEKCNLKCLHCYQEAKQISSEISYQGLLDVVEQFNELMEAMNRERELFPIRGHITVTGGEPFIRKDFMELLNVFNENRDKFSFAILTNGSLINETNVKRLHKLNPSFVQVSIEGTKGTNDAIRGQGSLDKTVAALKLLVREGIRSVISFTAHRSNYKEFPAVARLARELGVSRIWADRLVPWGNGHHMDSKTLSPEETRDFFELMYEAQVETSRYFCKTEVFMGRALQFLVAGAKPYTCVAGDSLITIMPNGDLYPCRRMPICVGNITKTPLFELYYNNELFRKLRDRDKISKGCETCTYCDRCRGGLKCLSYAKTKDPFNADPGCWRASKN